MDKKTTISIILAGSAIIVLALFIFFQAPNDKADLEMLKSKITYYYGEDCPHCKNVLKFIEENKIGEKVIFEKKEVSYDVKNGKEFGAVIKSCGISVSEAGVPLVFADGRCFAGELEVRDFFKQKAGISQ